MPFDKKEFAKSFAKRLAATAAVGAATGIASRRLAFVTKKDAIDIGSFAAMSTSICLLGFR